MSRADDGQEIFMRQARKIIRATPNHPLRKLLDANGKWLARSPYTNAGHQWPSVQAGHLLSRWAGGRKLALQEGQSNQTEGRRVETFGGVVQRNAVDIGGIPVDKDSVVAFERDGLVEPGTAANAQYCDGWKRGDVLTGGPLPTIAAPESFLGILGLVATLLGDPTQLLPNSGDRAQYRGGGPGGGAGGGTVGSPDGPGSSSETGNGYRGSGFGGGGGGTRHKKDRDANDSSTAATPPDDTFDRTLEPPVNHHIGDTNANVRIYTDAANALKQAAGGPAPQQSSSRQSLGDAARAAAQQKAAANQAVQATGGYFTSIQTHQVPNILQATQQGLAAQAAQQAMAMTATLGRTIPNASSAVTSTPGGQGPGAPGLGMGGAASGPPAPNPNNSYRVPDELLTRSNSYSPPQPPPPPPAPPPPPPSPPPLPQLGGSWTYDPNTHTLTPDN